MKSDGRQGIGGNPHLHHNRSEERRNDAASQQPNICISQCTKSSTQRNRVTTGRNTEPSTAETEYHQMKSGQQNEKERAEERRNGNGLIDQ